MTHAEMLLARYRNRPEIRRDYTMMEYLTGLALTSHAPEYAHNLRRARIDCAFFDHSFIEIAPEERIVGRFPETYELTKEQAELARIAREYKKLSGPLAGLDTAFTGHRVVDYEKLLNRGVGDILREIDGYLDRIDYSQPEAAGREAFYRASRLSLEGFVRFAGRVREKLLDMAREAEEPRRGELLAMAKNFEHAPMEPCRHFHEAVQMMWLLEYSLCALNDISLTGRMDNYLWPFYEKDVRDGVIDRQGAYELICEIYIKHNEIYGTWPASVMVGGLNRAGEPVWNEISDMCLDAIGDTGLVNPSVNICWTEHVPERAMQKALLLLSQGYTRPAFFNDRVIRAGLREAGVSEEDSRYYIHSTCVEITPIAGSNIQVATPYINLTKAFEYILGEGKPLYDAGEGKACAAGSRPYDGYYDVGEWNTPLESLTSFEKFSEAAFDMMGRIIHSELKRVTRDLYAPSHYASSPLASAFINDCLERGLDSGAGGARYSFVYPCFPGFLNVVDSLAAVRQAVYEEKVITLTELRDMLRNDFEGTERMRQYLVNRCPKIGNDLPQADEFGVKVYDFIRRELKDHTTCCGATFHPSFFAWIQHGYLGRVAAASPDGRRKGTALSESLGAVQGRDVNGTAALVRSIAHIDQKYGIGGIATNLRFTKKMMSEPAGRDAVKHFIEYFMDQNCFEIQLNVVDQSVLLDAKAHPENHRDLMVRVAGYSDYFVDLIPEIQDEIIRRNEHDSAG